jgi:hypothetical protein
VSEAKSYTVTLTSHELAALHKIALHARAMAGVLKSIEDQEGVSMALKVCAETVENMLERIEPNQPWRQDDAP